ncbi:MAG: hypothetical protein JWM21_1449 [Acidobacteria bacterium]|nr:hypothetical protein [Acidobacteriota bacterium]
MKARAGNKIKLARCPYLYLFSQVSGKRFYPTPSEAIDEVEKV